MSRFQFVADHSPAYADRGGVKRRRELVEITRSSYYARLAAAPARAQRIRSIHAGDNTVGAPRVTAESHLTVESCI